MPHPKKPMGPKMRSPQVAVIVVCWNNQDLLDECFGSIYAQTYKNWRIITIDNGSRDESVKLIKDNHPHVELIEPHKNLGFAVANNIGISRAFEDPECEYVLLLNTDARVREDWLEKMVGFALDHPDGAAFQSLTVDYYNHDIIDSCGILIDHNGLATQMGYRLKHVDLTTRKVFGVNAAAALYSRNFLKSQPFGKDYFDSDLFMYLEDVDIAARSIMLGWSNYFVNETIAFHMGSASSGKNPGFSFYMTYRNNGPMIIKNLPWEIIRKLMPGLIRVELARVRGLLRDRNYTLVWQMFRGRFWGLTMIPLFLKKRKQLKQHWTVDTGVLWDLMSSPRLRRMSLKELGLDIVPATIVLLSNNNINTIASSMKSLKSQHYSKFKIICVDNGSQDGSIKYIEEKFPDIQLIANPRSFGTAGGFNEGLVAAMQDLPEYICVARADVVYDANWLRSLTEVANQDLSVFAVSAAIKHGSKTIVGYTYEIAKSPHLRILETTKKSLDIFAPHSLGTLYRAEDLDKTGLFDGDFFNGLEEVDLAFRARNQGLKILCAPRALGVSESGIDKDFVQSNYHRYKNAYFIYLKNTPLKLLVSTLPIFVVGSIRALVRVAITESLFISIKIVLKSVLKTPSMLLSRSINQRVRKLPAEKVRQMMEESS